MLNAINTKILLAILAALTVIGSALVYQRRQSAEAAAAAAKAAAILQQQQKEAEAQKERDEAFRKRVEQNKARHNSAAAHEGKTWDTYLP
jgi:Flp pilus assembly protein TadG